MTSNFKKIFGITILHTYFNENVCKGVRFNAGEVTVQLIRRYGFRILKGALNEFEFYSNTKSDLPLFLDYVKATTGCTFFDFNLVILNKEFNLFTDIPVNWVGQMEFDSTHVKQSEDGSNIQLIAKFGNSNGTGNGGRLRIYFADILKYWQQECPVFNIQFEARATQWQYYVVIKNTLSMNQPSITGKSGIAFRGPEKVKMGTGESALFFTSGDCLIPLSEKPRHIFDLVSTRNESTAGAESTKITNRIVLKSLPNPDPKKMSLIRIGKLDAVASPMYVYV